MIPFWMLFSHKKILNISALQSLSVLVSQMFPTLLLWLQEPYAIRAHSQKKVPPLQWFSLENHVKTTWQWKRPRWRMKSKTSVPPHTAGLNNSSAKWKVCWLCPEPNKWMEKNFCAILHRSMCSLKYKRCSADRTLRASLHRHKAETTATVDQ